MATAETAAEYNKGALARLRPWAPIALACCLLSAYSTRSGAPAPILDLSWRDKVDHFCVYALLGALVFQALPARIAGTPRWLLAFALVSAFGLWDETLQHFNVARTGDPLDWLADSLGALCAAALCSAFPTLRKIAGWRCLPILSKQKACSGESTTGPKG